MLSPWKVLNTARRAVPVVDFALGAAGVAAAAAIVVGFLGYSRTTFIIFGAMLIAMLLLIIFARLLSVRSKPIVMAGIAMVWAVAMFFITFLIFTATAVAMKWPRVWATLLMGNEEPPAVLASKVCGQAIERLQAGSCKRPNGQYVVTNIRWDDSDHGLVVREKPGISGIQRGIIPPVGTDVYVGQCNDENWCEVECNEMKGWSRGRYLAKRENALFHVVSAGGPEELSIRNGPDDICTATGSIPNNATDVIVHSCEPGSSDQKMWCNVTYKGKSGFVLGARLQK